jgi:hypothetical protein
VNRVDARGQCAAHHEPHDELHTLRSGEPHEVVDRITRECLRIVDDLLEALEIELLVDEPGAFAVELMRQTAVRSRRRIFGVRRDRAASAWELKRAGVGTGAAVFTATGNLHEAAIAGPSSLIGR